MNPIEELKKPTKEEQLAAMASYSDLVAALEQIRSKNSTVEIEETKQKIKIPTGALKLLAKILKATSEGKPISVVPITTEITTQAAAEVLGCSRPHFVKLLETGKIAFTKVGKHRRVMHEDVMKYKNVMKTKQKALIVEMMKADDEAGLYDE